MAGWSTNVLQITVRGRAGDLRVPVKPDVQLVAKPLRTATLPQLIESDATGERPEIHSANSLRALRIMGTPSAADAANPVAVHSYGPEWQGAAGQ